MRTLQIKAQEKHGGTSPASLRDPAAPHPWASTALLHLAGRKSRGGVSPCLRKASANQATQGSWTESWMRSPRSLILIQTYFGW